MYSKVTESLVLAFIAPWILAVTAIRANSIEYQQWILTLLFVVFGSLMILGTGDGYVHQQAVQGYYSQLSFEEFATELWSIITFKLSDARSTSKDVYIHVLSYLFGSVLHAPKLFFPFVAGVYGYFYSGSVLIVLKNMRWRSAGYVVTIFALIFLFIKGPDGFYTVRTWTGLWVLVYSCLKFFETKHARYAVLMFVPPLIHIGWFVMAIPAWSVMLFGNKPRIYTLIFLVSAVTTVLPTQDAADILSSTERGAMQVEAYRVEERAIALEDFEQLQGQTNWYNAYRKSGLQRWAPTILILAMLASGIYPGSMNAFQRRVFSIGLLTMALSNSTWFLYAMHNRSLTVAMVFLLAAFLLGRLDQETHRGFVGRNVFYRWSLHLSIAAFVPLIIFNLSVLTDRLSIFILGLPIVAWVSPEFNMSVKHALNVVIGRGG